ncbi:MAG: sigma-70 family RNA polymerase sigma factor [Planctomycetes bacterium]|nr:sigma-70 family RNA polymerase sigma factor [Planctomycetota bacterium]
MTQAAGRQELVDRHLEPLRRFVAFLGCPAGDVDDVVQEVFAVAFTSAVPADERAGPWLRAAARHRLLALLRQRRRDPAVLDDDEAAWRTFARVDDGDGWLEALRACTGELEPRARLVLQLRYREAMPARAIGGHVALTPAGVETLLVRLRRRLRACVERRLP